MAEPTKQLAREPTEKMWAAAESNMAALDEQGQFPDFFDTWRVMWDAASETEPSADAREAVIKEVAELIENGFHVQHPTKPTGVSAVYIEGDARRAAAIRTLARVAELERERELKVDGAIVDPSTLRALAKMMALESDEPSDLRGLRARAVAGAADQIEASEARCDALRKALEPFAKQDIEHMLSLEELDLDREHFFAARAALQPSPTAAGEE